MKIKALIMVGILILLVSNLCLCTDSGEENEDHKDQGNGDNPLTITAKNPSKKVYGWQIEISNIYNGTLKLEDAKFQAYSKDIVFLYSLTISDANPAAFLKGVSKIYALTKGAEPVMNEDNITVDADDSLTVYKGCYIAYADQTDDGYVNGGDTIYIYKDYNKDGTDDILSNYRIRVVGNDNIALEKVL